MHALHLYANGTSHATMADHGAIYNWASTGRRRGVELYNLWPLLPNNDKITFDASSIKTEKKQAS